MKQLLSFILGMVLLGACYAGFTVFGPNVIFSGLSFNGDSPHLVLSGEQVFKSQNVGAYAYINNAPTTTTSDEVRHALSGTFTNEVVEGFIGSGDMIVYQGHQRRFLIMLNRDGMTDTTATTMGIGVKINGNILTGSIVDGKLANVSDHIAIASLSQAQLISGDTVQLVVRSNKNAVLTADTVVASAIAFY